MSYCTQQDMINRYGERELVLLTNRDVDSVTINATVLGSCIADADGEIDGYLQGRYTLPLSTVPRVLVGYACDLARYRLYDDRATERVVAAYEEAIAFLTKVSTGRVSLGIDGTGNKATIVGGAAADSADRVFTDYTLKDFL